MKGNKGFTIVEMLIVIVIMAILAAVAVPNIISWRANAALSGDTRTLKADFELARSRAIKDNTSVTISFDTGNNSYSIRIMGIPPFPAPLPDPILTRSLVGTSITTNLTGGAITTTFDSRGRVNNTGDITLSNGSKKAQVTVNMIGSVRVN